MDRLAVLQIFATVMEAGSFSSAARQLDMGQPAVSKAIAQLEERLHTRLFLRNTHGLSSTEAARAFYEHARQALAQLEAAEQAARGEGAALTGLLRVTAPVTFSRMQVIPHLPRFFAAHPGLRMDLVQDDRPVDLLREGVDMALRIGALDDSSMTARHLARTDRILVGSRDYLERHGTPTSPGSLTEHSFVLYTHGGVTRELAFQGAKETQRVTVKGPLCVSAAEGLRAAVLAGVGLAVTSRWVFRDELLTREVLSLLPDWSLGSIDLWAVYPSGRLPSAKARALADFVETLMRPDEADPISVPQPLDRHDAE